ncbi:hypothetical protein [Flavobacterium gilvum]|uniref:Uncharacterized protein n=1 Tax=Flavobacterium gilvum TaxID=1492737 RepID=A0AAC9I4J7_9FLAO|nr:hypothetical protein [Flavobacterium gilvum]AOW08733.1 hypothetical protein EM308_04025 [Flavobacterium gilvum]KFC59828.1 hypothetical protein FEM08_13390 [Flavobacterium gilvum]
MEGKDIYNALVVKRDYSGSTADEYAQFLMSLFLHLGKDLFPLLESAHKESKTLTLKSEILNSDVLVDEYTIEDIILV